VRLVESACGYAGSLSFLDDVQRAARRSGITRAIRKRDTPAIFDWLVNAFSFQGISDQVARSYLSKHGGVTWHEITTALAAKSPCPLTASYWQFDGCRYDKGSFTCCRPELIEGCSLPGHPLRNGRLNQMAYSLYLFIRDIAKNDFVGWIDKRLATAVIRPDVRSARTRTDSIIGPLRNIYGVSDKILTMALSELMIGSGRPTWLEAGTQMIAIDTLVHNFLHRTGILDECGAPHAYGVRCYQQNGCAHILYAMAAQVDAGRFNSHYPKVFPRFIQHAIWRYCAGDGLSVCNGNRIDDRKACDFRECQLHNICAHKPLKLMYF
jgi:hypothetical protein